MPVTIVKNTKVVKLSRMKGSIKSTLRYAEHKAHEQGWSRIIIVGEGKSSGNYSYSRMDANDAIAMLEKAKIAIINGMH